MDQGVFFPTTSLLSKCPDWRLKKPPKWQLGPADIATELKSLAPLTAANNQEGREVEGGGWRRWREEEGEEVEEDHRPTEPQLPPPNNPLKPSSTTLKNDGRTALHLCREIQMYADGLHRQLESINIPTQSQVAGHGVVQSTELPSPSRLSQGPLVGVNRNHGRMD